ncbi:hypothetical protein MPSEU_000065500 [Mayamaea pseudoterrestris]|nr:hypothetical protein MPSEU_000065500 [Mayamaea pseudoterrestris]
MRSLVWIKYKQSKFMVKLLVRKCSENNSAMEQDDETSISLVKLSPLAAANLGIYLNDASTTKQLASLSPCRESPVAADNVFLRLYARPNESLRRRRQGPHARDATAPVGDDANNDDDADNPWPLPLANTLLQPNVIIRVKRETDGESFWYQVLKINHAASSSSFNNHSLFQSKASTTYSLEAPPFAPCPRLPPLTSHAAPHPNLNELTKRLQCTRVSRPAECLLHLMGTNDNHHLDALVAAAATQSGRRLVTLPRGWAAYSFRASGNLVANGGLMDKLNGLQEALVHAKRCVPALLHVCFDAVEFSSHDDEQYFDEQSRVWSMLMEQLSACDYSQCSNHNDYEALVPPLLVVLSTANPLKRGPLTENLVFEPIQASTPDSDYIKYLWKNVPNVEMEQLMSILTGRPACEIETLRDQFLQIAHTTAASNFLSVIQELAKELDKKRRSGLARIPQVQWSDVGGLQSVRREILDTIELPLQHPHLFSGRRSGILLYGPPGSGKTLVAKAVATECNFPFLSVKGPELLGSYVGESEENVRTIFSQARQLAKANQIPGCVLFFDELDSLAPRRGDQASGGGSVMDRVVATLFAELDRNQNEAAVYCLGATNRPDLLDPALLRPGRLDRLVYLGMSSRDDQTKILAAQMRKLTLERDVTEMAQLITDRLPANLSGADLSMVVSKALMRATERLCDEADREAALERNKGDETISVDQVLASWDDERLTPIVTLDDLQWASQHVVPSVSEVELKGYERLRDQFQVELSGSTTCYGKC